MLNDLRYAFRILVKSPAFTFFAVLTLALGIGANSAIFGILHSILLNPLPYPQPDRLVQVKTVITPPGRPPEMMNWWSYPRFKAFRDHASCLEQVAAQYAYSDTLVDGDGASRVQVELVSANYFPMLGIQPELGRVFLPEEDRSAGIHPVALISHGLWQRRYGGATNIIGQAISLNKIKLTIVGVLPTSFRGLSGSVELWAPIMMTPQLQGIPRRLEATGSSWHAVIGRLRPEITLEQARRRLPELNRELQQRLPASAGANSTRIDFVSLKESLTDPAMSRSVVVLFAAAVFVLLIACVNLANLFLARAVCRQAEMNLRLALGASRGRLLRQMLVEGLVLTVVTSLAALWVRELCLDLLSFYQPENRASFLTAYARLPEFELLSWNGPALAFHAGLSLAAGLGCSLFPALKQKAHCNYNGLHQITGLAHPSPGGRGLQLRNLLVVGETALAVVLLVGAGLMLHSFLRLSHSQLGFQPEGVLTARVELPRVYSETSTVQFYNQLLERLQALPGVEFAAVSSATPLSSSFDRTTLKQVSGAVESKAAEPVIGIHLVSLDFPQTMRMPLLKGRWLEPQDQSGREDAVVINEAAARQFWPGQDPIGQTLKLGLDLKGPAARVVGVVGNVRYDSMDTPFQPQAYLSINQLCYSGCYILMRGARPPQLYASDLRQSMASLNREIPLYEIKTMPDRIAGSLSRSQFSAFLLSSYAGLAVLMAAIGIYGIISYTVAGRTREIGIRMALGAHYLDVIRMVLGQGMTLVFLGLGLGLIASLGLTRFMSSLLFEVRPHDPATFLAVTGLFTGIALLACYLPARRAARVDPAISLRWE